MKKTTSPYLYEYPTLQAGVLVERRKRFFADIELPSGEIVTAHCPNTGPMTGVCQIGNLVQISTISNNPKRKLAYTWELIQVHDNKKPVWVGVNTSLPNHLVKLALEKKLFPALGAYGEIKKEVVYGAEGKSRVDFCLLPVDDKSSQKIYLEVKNTTWCQGSLALFPDTVTTRGHKHLQELMAVVEAGHRAVCLYLINRGDCDRFAPGDRADKKYGELLRQAYKMGVQILPCRFDISPQGVQYLGLAELVL